MNNNMSYIKLLPFILYPNNVYTIRLTLRLNDP
jgi:hypothetical protein